MRSDKNWTHDLLDRGQPTKKHLEKVGKECQFKDGIFTVRVCYLTLRLWLKTWTCQYYSLKDNFVQARSFIDERNPTFLAKKWKHVYICYTPLRVLPFSHFKRNEISLDNNNNNKRSSERRLSQEDDLSGTNWAFLLNEQREK